MTVLPVREEVSMPSPPKNTAVAMVPPRRGSVISHPFICINKPKRIIRRLVKNSEYPVRMQNILRMLKYLTEIRS